MRSFVDRRNVVFAKFRTKCLWSPSLHNPGTSIFLRAEWDKSRAEWDMKPGGMGRVAIFRVLMFESKLVARARENSGWETKMNLPV